MCPRTEGAGRGRLLKAAGWATLWRRAQPRSACPQPRGHALTLRHLGLTGSPHQPRRGQRQHQRRFLRVLLSVFSKSFNVRGTLRGAGALGSADAALGEGLQALAP